MMDATSTVFTRNFDIDSQTGFMPSQPPITRLPIAWEAWEEALGRAISSKLQLGTKPGLSEEEKLQSEVWRSQIRALPVQSILALQESEVLLRRAHHVLTWIMHFYIHSLPPYENPVRIPQAISIPVLHISAHLELPPVLTYSDNVLYNWTQTLSSSETYSTLNSLRCTTLFTGTRDEEVFYLTSARMELRGVEGLEIMRLITEESFAAHQAATNRITEYLQRLAIVIDDLERLLMTVRDGCDPTIYYREIRPWLKGIDSHQDATRQEWIFEGLEDHSNLTYPEELSGPSAGQSSLIHALDLFLGVDRYSHSSNLTGGPGPIAAAQASKRAFLARMRVYMPRHHRNFLRHLETSPLSLRAFVDGTNDPLLLKAYNHAVISLKKLRDSHLIIVALYIVQPARKEQKELHEGQIREGGKNDAPESLKGTGGSDIMKLLKGVRDATAGAVM